MFLSHLNNLIPISASAALHTILTALVIVHNSQHVVDCHVPLLGLFLQGIGHCGPELFVDDGEFLPAVVIEEGDDGFGDLSVWWFSSCECWNGGRHVIGAFL